MFGTLYIVATPIGNLEDITLRALKILRDVDLILAEDTRVASKLLMHYEIDRPILSYHQQSDERKKQQVLTELLTGKNIALVTDAGTPGISDPGNELVEYVLDREPKIKIIPVPGPSSVTALLSVSGVRADKYLFLGYFPKKGKTKLYKLIEDVDIPVVFFESPYRILKTLIGIKEQFGDQKRIVVGQELTKIFEKVRRGKVSDVILELEKEVAELSRVKGEITLIVCP